MISKDLTYAVIGASNNKEKYGYKVFVDLKNAGYKAIPINPNEGKIDNELCYHKLGDYIGNIDVAIFVVPPSITELVLNDVKKKGIKIVWMQPGSESEKAIEYCEKHNINFTINSCIMIERKK